MPATDPVPSDGALSGTSLRAANSASYRAPQLTGLFDVLDEPMRDLASATALIVGERRVTISYQQLAALAADLAGQLAECGLRPGGRIALQARNGPEFVVGLLAAARAKLVVAPLDSALATRERTQRLAEMRAQVLLTDSPSAPLSLGDSAHDTLGCPHWVITVPLAAGHPAKQAPPQVTLDVDRARQLRPGVQTSGPASVPASGPADRDATRAGHDSKEAPSVADSASSVGPPAVEARDAVPNDSLILFTSGTTDRPKMVPLTHGNVAASVRAICSTYEFRRDDATVAAMPFFHGHGLLAGLLSPLASGGSVLIPAAGRFTAHTFWDDMQAARATWVTAVPTIYQILLERAAAEYPGPDRCQLRFLRSCSAPLNPTAINALQATFHAPVLCAYGMTETTHQAASQPLPANGPDQPGSVGSATGTTIRVVDAHSQDAPVGQTGEVWVRGPTVTRGYLDNPTETARSFTDGWFHTGDLGLLSADGYLTLTGRIKELINRGGEKISPARVEAVLGAYPGVLEAAVFGIPDPKYGERVAAAVVAPAGVTAAQLLRYCSEHLARFEIPSSIQLVAELPHTPKGALDRRAVAARFAG